MPFDAGRRFYKRGMLFPPSSLPVPSLLVPSRSVLPFRPVLPSSVPSNSF
ncbi:hypothetical protein M077_4025 [Bacteroides fragilis str. 2-F-2 |nr:hypothetical protein M077_4025 [Bacteroides fragilis str. 2-F-2 \